MKSNYQNLLMLSQALHLMLNDRVYGLLGLQFIVGQFVNGELIGLILQDHLAVHLTNVLLHRIVG